MKRTTSMKLRSRHALPRVSDEMRQWSELLLQELLSWRDVSTRPMFGMTALYRGKDIFAVLPKTRAMQTAYSVGFKLRNVPLALERRIAAEPRFVSAHDHIGKMAGWRSFELTSGDDIRDAIEWFARAYEQASTPKRKAS